MLIFSRRAPTVAARAAPPARRLAASAIRGVPLARALSAAAADPAAEGRERAVAGIVADIVADAPPTKRKRGITVGYGDVAEAAYRIKDGVRHTPCTVSMRCSQLALCDLHFKDDFRQRTGSFKERGARNALLELSDEAKRVGVVTASAGNHALALAYHASELGIPCTCIMPTTAPLTKVVRCGGFGATVEQVGEHIGEARTFADTLVASQGLTYINGFDDAAIIAGAGSMAIEVLEQVPGLDAIVVPVGGGGLIAGIATVVKRLKPNVLVIGASSR